MFDVEEASTEFTASTLRQLLTKISWYKLLCCIGYLVGCWSTSSNGDFPYFPMSPMKADLTVMEWLMPSCVRTRGHLQLVMATQEFFDRTVFAGHLMGSRREYW
jgi:hypothetical protein